ncbi:C-X-C chemokine receptor type 1 [Chanos chanos]|uniref:C-X-C chemokine receptor type 2 n=1 Tax=Chanos chanos TaxID=29144 RepID=A0A6J2WJJ0_CHACN|nr:C-X-C chemokine receptor type 1-like [Chanos chanos]
MDSDEDNFSYPTLWPEPCSVAELNLNSMAIIIIYITVFFLGLVGNSVVIFVVSSMENRRTSTDVYLMHLAVADLLFSLTLPFWAVYVRSGWVFGTFLCKLLSGVQEAALYSCVFLLACISIDRYLAIVKATQVTPRSHQLVGIVCIVVWLGACLLSLPVMIQRESFMPEGQAHLFCYENLTAEVVDEWRVSLRILKHALGFFLPLAVMLVCYSCTVATLFRARNSQKHKAMRVILSVVLAFVICWLPKNIIMLLDTLIQGQHMDHSCELVDFVDTALHITQIVAFMHCAINPILYAFIGKKFRNQFLISLHKKGLIGREILSSYRVGSVYSSANSRHTSVTL